MLQLIHEAIELRIFYYRMKDFLCRRLDKSAHAAHEYFYLIASEESGKIKDLQSDLLEPKGNYGLIC